MNFFILSVLYISCTTVFQINCKRVKSYNVDKSEEIKESKSDEDIIPHNKYSGSPDPSPSPSPSQARNLTFMISARNLGRLPAKYNTYVSMFYESSSSDLNVLSSEVITGSVNPDWSTVFWYFWKKGTEQTIKFKVKSQIKKQADQLIGEVTLDVDDFVENDETIEMSLDGIGTKGIIKIEKTTPISFRLSAKNLARKDTFHSKSDPYVVCYWRLGPDGPDVRFAQTSVINNVEDADWIDIITFDAYQPGKNQYWSFKVYDDDGFTSDDFLGDAYVRVDPFIMESDTKSKTVNLSLKGSLTVKLV